MCVYQLLNTTLWKHTFHAETESYAETIRSALCETFVRLDNEWATHGHLAGARGRVQFLLDSLSCRAGFVCLCELSFS